MATRKEHLRRSAVSRRHDYLADDFQLGNRIVRIAGKRIVLCPVVVDCLSQPMSWPAAWSHQLRWARTIRVCRPVPYAFSILSNATLWPLLWVAAQPAKGAMLTLATCLAFRIFSAQSLQKRLGHVKGQGWFCWLTPVKDLLHFVLWASAFLGSHIVWRGSRFRVQRDGRLVRA